jgi:pyruvate dehydrogenase E1 component alpha subunit
MNAIDKEIALEIEKAVEDGLAAPHPDPATDLMSDVYCSY